jgi:hypothetical protein
MKFWFPLCLTALCWSCAEHAPREAPAETSDRECIDQDRDGFGRDCALGPDCDDSDVATHVGCTQCALPDEGCACEPGAQPLGCFLDKTVEEAVVMCHEGTRYCRDGSWSACEDIHSYPREEFVQSQALINPDGGAVACSDCAVKCFVIRDNLDPVDGGLGQGNSNGSGWAPGGGLTLGAIDGGRWVPPPPDGGYGTGPTDNPDENAACTLGVAPDSDCDGIDDEFDPYPAQRPFASTSPAIFLDVAPGETGTGVIDLRFFVNSVDVYFLLDQTKSMQSVQTRVKGALTDGTFLPADVECADTDLNGSANQELKDQGILGAIRCLMRDAKFGAGFLRELPFDSYGDDDEILFRNLMDVDDDTAAALAAVTAMSAQDDEDWPDAHPLALYSLATGNGHYFGVNKPGVLPRVGCPAGTWGYPCFRDEAIPIVVLFTDSPPHNGPPNPLRNDDYDPAKLAITTGSGPGYFPVPPTNDTFDQSFDLGELSDNYLLYASDTGSLTSNYDSAMLTCLGAASDDAPDAVYSFSLAAQTALQVSTAGSAMSAAYAIYNHVPETPTAIATANANDNWLSALDVGPVFSGWRHVSGNTSAMAPDYTGAFVGCGAADAAADAVYRFALSQPTRVSIDSSGSSFDTALALYRSAPALPTSVAANNSNDTTASAQNLGSMSQRIHTVTGGSTAGAAIHADYQEAQVGCSGDDAANDAVYRFSLDAATRMRFETTGSAFDTVLTLSSGEFGSQTSASVPATNDLQASAHDMGDLIGAWLGYSGSTALLAANYRQDFIGCNAGTGSRDAVFHFQLSEASRVRLDTAGSAFDTVLSLHNGPINPVTIQSNATNTNETGSTALSLGDPVDRWVEVTGASTAAMAADYEGTTTGCGGDSSASDAVYSFTVSRTANVRLDTVGSSFDTILSLHDARPPRHAPTSHDTTLENPNVGLIDDTSRVYSGTTVGKLSNYGGATMGCNATDDSPEVQFSFQLAADTFVELNSSGSAFDTVLGLYRDTVQAPKRPASVAIANTNEAKASAYPVGAIDGQWFVYTGSTASMADNYDSFGCGVDKNALDAAFSFTVTTRRKVRVSTVGSSFDTVVGIFDSATDVLQGCDNDSGASATSVLSTTLDPGTYYVLIKGNKSNAKGPYTFSIQDDDAANVVVCDDELGGSGTSRITAQLQAGSYHVLLKGKSSTGGAYKLRITDLDWFDIHHRLTCDDNSGGGLDSRIDRTLQPGTYYAVVKADLALEKGAYFLNLRDLGSTLASSHNLGCNDDGSGLQSVIEQDLPAGDYWAVVKGKGTTSGPYQLNARDLGPQAQGSRIACNDDASGAVTHSLFEQDLAAGSYFLFVKGDAAADKGAYTLKLTDLGHAADDLVACNADGGSGGGTSRIVQDLPAGNYWAVLKGAGAAAKGAYSLTFRDENSATRTRYACDSDGTGNVTLAAGDYDLIVKGSQTAQKGAYQLAIGDGQTMAGTYVPPSWSTTLDALNDREVRVLSVINCHDNGMHGDGRDCDDARAAAVKVANATEAVGMNLEPLVVDIDSNGTGVEEAVVHSLRELTGHLEMDVTVRVVFEPDANPGFVVKVKAADKPGDGCDGLVGIVHKKCRPGATPTFYIEVTNPYGDPVPRNPNDPMGGYNFRADLIADGKYAVASVPIYVIPEDVDDSLMSQPLLQTTGQYWQDLAAPGCLDTEAPDWRDLSWTAEVPDGTAVSFNVCTAQEQADLETCTYANVGNVRGGGPCTSDAQCGLGFCAPEGNCQTITGGPCAVDQDCGGTATCESNVCVYPSQPVFVGYVLGSTGNLNNFAYLRMNLGLTANTTTNKGPTVHDWALTYWCQTAN